MALGVHIALDVDIFTLLPTHSFPFEFLRLPAIAVQGNTKGQGDQSDRYRLNVNRRGL
jgi:hypothetical protein